MVNSRAEIARHCGLSRARVTPVMSLLHLPDETQEHVLAFSPREQRLYSGRRLAQWEADEEAFSCCEHAPPGSFVRGEPMPVELLISDAVSLDVRLCYRHVNQAEPHVGVQMEREDGCYRARIPAAYTDSPYPLQYYFELPDGAGRAWLHPGFNEVLWNQPYYVVRQK